MCGISGFLQRERRPDEAALASLARRMSDTLRHRGPDDAGVWVDARAGVALGHRRLSIIDLSVEGAQPMRSSCGRWVIVYNGEIYNFGALRAELEAAGRSFRGHSDTEVLLEGIAAWGVPEALERSNGMFAFAVWDRHERALTLARDRAGKKPLYYGWCGDAFLFGSELKALRVHPEFDPEIDRDALGLFVRYSWIPSPHSIHRRIRKLEPGCWLRVTAGPRGDDAVPRRYWSARRVAESAAAAPFAGSESEAVEAVDARLREAVAARMVSDVPLGALLSGGIDSSTVVALMQAQSAEPVRTFSIGFEEESHDEAPFARAVAKHLGTDHRELRVTGNDALSVVPKLPGLWDEPFADASQIPTAVVSRLARSEVTVALSGDGGDELFAGYRRYFRVLRHWASWGRLPAPLRRAAAAGLRGASRTAAVLPAGGSAVEPSSWRALPGVLERFAGRLVARDERDLFARMNARCGRADEFVIGAREVPVLLTDPSRWPDLDDPLRFMMCLDFSLYIPECIQVKVDRASMGVSLEVRCPLLDVHVLELAWSLPTAMQVEGGTGKRILRRVLDRYVPRGLTDRPKRGFGVPVAAWLRGPLRDWAEALLDERRLREEGALEPAAVRRVWSQHLSGRYNHEKLLWHLLVFQAWREA